MPADDEVPPGALLASAAVDIVDLRSVYAGVRALYPDTPYAERAEYILDALDAERQALQDSLNAAADSLALPVASDSLHFPADSLAVAGLPDSLHVFADSLAGPALSGIPTGEFSLYGPGGVQAALGGFTIALDAHAEREPMETLIAPYLQQGLRVAVVVDSVDDAAVYLAVLGHFSSEEAAEAGLQGARYMLGDLAQTARVLPLNTP